MKDWVTIRAQCRGYGPVVEQCLGIVAVILSVAQDGTWESVKGRLTFNWRRVSSGDAG